MCPTYCVAKALLNRAGQLLAADEAFKQRGVSVVSVCPGWCRCGPVATFVVTTQTQVCVTEHCCSTA
jgi:NAD(P)-dependent dehydrogenase (short-subunit alcohol dehydrogenase family)